MAVKRGRRAYRGWAPPALEPRVQHLGSAPKLSPAGTLSHSAALLQKFTSHLSSAHPVVRSPWYPHWSKTHSLIHSLTSIH